MHQPLEEVLGREIADIIKMQLAPLQQRIHHLEAREPKAGRDGVDGKSVDLATVVAQLTPLLEQKIEKLFAEFPKPVDGKDGAPGRDGKDVDTEAVVERLAEFIPSPIQGTAGPAGPVGPAGKDGAEGQPGRDGKDADAQQLIEQVIALMPAPRDGKDGVGIATTLIDRQGNLIITKTDGAIHNAGIVVGRDGKDGLPGAKGEDGAAGRDGFGFDDMEGMDDGLRFGHRFRRGDLVKEFWFNKASLADFDHEIWRAGINYPRGAVVTTNGSLYICKQETNERPGSNGAKHWRLAVKCGRDGKDGERGPIGPAGPKGENATLY